MATTAAPRSEKGNQGSKDFWQFTVGHETTPELVWPNSIEVYDQMRRQDTQIKAVLSAVTLPIRRAKWWVEPAGASPEVTRFIADNLGLPVKGEALATMSRGQDRFSWDEHVRLALLELVFGHSFFEQVYRLDPDGRARLRRLGWRPPRTITKITTAPDGGLVSIEQQGIDGNPLVTIPVGQLVAYVHDREGANWLGQSLLRPAYKYWLLKDRMLRVQAQTNERNGMGVPIYTGPEFSSYGDPIEVQIRQQADIEQGLELASGIRSGENAGASIPYGAKLEMRGVTGTLPDVDKVIRYYDEQISAAVLANFLKLGGSDTTGSYALGETFANFFVMSLQTIALHVADVATQHIVGDLVDINFGTDVPAPRIGFEEIGTQQHATAGGISQLVACGALTPGPALDAYLRDKLDIPTESEVPSGTQWQAVVPHRKQSSYPR